MLNIYDAYYFLSKSYNTALVYSLNMALIQLHIIIYYKSKPTALTAYTPDLGRGCFLMLPTSPAANTFWYRPPLWLYTWRVSLVDINPFSSKLKDCLINYGHWAPVHHRQQSKSSYSPLYKIATPFLISWTWLLSNKLTPRSCKK